MCDKQPPLYTKSAGEKRVDECGGKPGGVTELVWPSGESEIRVSVSQCSGLLSLFPILLVLPPTHPAVNPQLRGCSFGESTSVSNSLRLVWPFVGTGKYMEQFRGGEAWHQFPAS